MTNYTIIMASKLRRILKQAAVKEFGMPLGVCLVAEFGTPLGVYLL